MQRNAKNAVFIHHEKHPHHTNTVLSPGPFIHDLSVNLRTATVPANTADNCSRTLQCGIPFLPGTISTPFTLYVVQGRIKKNTVQYSDFPTSLYLILPLTAGILLYTPTLYSIIYRAPYILIYGTSTWYSYILYIIRQMPHLYCTYLCIVAPIILLLLCTYFITEFSNYAIVLGTITIQRYHIQPHKCTDALYVLCYLEKFEFVITSTDSTKYIYIIWNNWTKLFILQQISVQEDSTYI